MKLIELLKGKDRRNIPSIRSTSVYRKPDGSVALCYHQTEVLIEDQDGWTVNSGGWKTPTTKARLNDYLPLSIYQRNGIWYWKDGTMFTDGDRVTFDGRLIAQAKPESEKADKQLRKRILKYARLCSNAIPLAHPSGGDCWYCCMVTENKETLGDAFKATDHLESHMEEEYAVPSLVYHALKEAGNTQFVIAGAFKQDQDTGYLQDIAKERTKRAVAKYMYRRFGLAS